MKTCAGCGFQTVSEEYDICPICNWEWDNTQNEDPEYNGGANNASLKQHQISVQRLLWATDNLGTSILKGFHKDPDFVFVDKLDLKEETNG